MSMFKVVKLAILVAPRCGSLYNLGKLMLWLDGMMMMMNLGKSCSTLQQALLQTDHVCAIHGLQC
jgi:hypothetical protein